MTDWLNRTHVGDCRALLRQMAADGVKVQTCVTSPPYFGLRDYGTAQWIGGDPACAHTGNVKRAGPPGTAKQARNAGSLFVTSGDCDCGARRVDNQIGLESTAADYVAQMVAVFAAVREVLADDGTLWLNLGDSYNPYNGGAGPRSALSRGAQTTERPDLPTGYGLKVKSAKPKDLLGIPWRVAFALQADGWYLRSDIIWHKSNPMPESVTDRPTKAHEYLFLLAKSERYYYDQDAIAEESATPAEGSGIGRGTKIRAHAMDLGPSGNEKPGMNWIQPETRNRRTVWTVTTKPQHEAHFACFPPELIEPCVLAGAPAGGIVLDPFMGSGTTARVATSLGRQFIGCELNPAYVEIQDTIGLQAGMAF